MDPTVLVFRSTVKTCLKSLSNSTITIEECESEILAALVSILIETCNSSRNLRPVAICDQSQSATKPSPSDSLSRGDTDNGTEGQEDVQIGGQRTPAVSYNSSSPNIHTLSTPTPRGESEGRDRSQSATRKESQSATRKLTPEQVFVRCREEYRGKVGESLGPLAPRRNDWEKLVNEYGSDIVINAITLWAKELGKSGRKLDYPLAVFLKYAQIYLNEADLLLQKGKTADSVNDEDDTVTVADLRRERTGRG